MSDFLNAIETLRQQHITAVLLVYLDFASGPIYVHSGVGDLVYEGINYRGIGVLGKIGSVKENGKVAPDKLTLGLSGIPSELLSTMLTEYYQNRPARISVVILDNDTQLPIAGDVIFAGRMDVAKLTDGDTSTISLNVNSRAIDWKNARNGRYTDADQQAKYPGDKFFEFVPQAVDHELQWGIPGGTSSVNSSASGSGAGGTSTRTALK
ncbi:hypothetical protein KDN34_02885 [Shewanella yunxiaonensis]|uniref:Uncharacterized protein n=1 Tax=Shewanella yunxiaonensis TaxID=2829809 RepID=A0ABX7YW92_9GAMM|nr:hypothetical protein [Shewanella yunxiaonensis]QUN06426.1 hypothetical protein KDN34_02885 [Shewanella yunxiaonensis]